MVKEEIKTVTSTVAFTVYLSFMSVGLFIVTLIKSFPSGCKLSSCLWLVSCLALVWHFLAHRTVEFGWTPEEVQMPGLAAQAVNIFLKSL